MNIEPKEPEYMSNLRQQLSEAQPKIPLSEAFASVMRAVEAHTPGTVTVVRVTPGVLESFTDAQRQELSAAISRINQRWNF